jgi:hypothetical protein
MFSFCAGVKVSSKNEIDRGKTVPDSRQNEQTNAAGEYPTKIRRIG